MRPLWRLIESGPEGGGGDAFFNMALDEAIATAVREDNLPPTLRFYGWQRRAVSIGCFQRAADLDIDYIEEAAIPLVRRPTGGRAILHGNELTYSFSSRNAGLFSGGLMESYTLLGNAFLKAFQKVGLSPEIRTGKNIAGGRIDRWGPHCFRAVSLGEITVSAVKVIGSAQRRWPEGFLQQGSIPFDLDRKGLTMIFKTPTDSLAGLLELNPEITPAALKKAIVESFSEAFGVALTPSAPTAREEALARDLLREKYLLRQWTFRR